MPRVAEEFDRIYLDGFLMCWYFKLLGCDIARVSFDMTSKAPEVFANAVVEGKSLIFICGEPGVSLRASEIISEYYPGLNVVRSYHGFFESTEARNVAITDIVSRSPDCVIVGMGAGIQEEFLLDLKGQGFSGEGFTCGGFFHQTAIGKVNYYPTWVNRYGLRWAYRCYKEPKVIKRVLLYYPLNSILFLYDCFQSRIRRE